jgi:hypothetical protein
MVACVTGQTSTPETPCDTASAGRRRRRHRGGNEDGADEKEKLEGGRRHSRRHHHRRRHHTMRVSKGTPVKAKTLKRMLKKAGLKVSGKKSTLRSRARKAHLIRGGYAGLASGPAPVGM